MARPNARQRGYGRAHELWRMAVLRKHTICVMCNKARARHADHIVPIRQGGSRFDPANGQGLCQNCHNSAKQAQDKRGHAIGCDVNGKPRDSSHHWHKE